MCKLGVSVEQRTKPKSMTDVSSDCRIVPLIAYLK